MEHISHHLQKLGVEKQETARLAISQSSTSEINSIEEITLLKEIVSGTKIGSAPRKLMEEALRYALLKTGIRSQNLPAKEELLVIYDHTLRFYPGHTVGEFRLAFDLAISGQLDLSENDINPYQSFDCLYVSRILNAYRKWATQVYNQHRPSVDVPMRIENHCQVDWRQQVQEALNDFFQGKIRFRLMPSEMYEQIVIDGYINHDAYQVFLEVAKTRLCSEVQKEVVSFDHGLKRDQQLNKDRYRSFEDLQRKLSEYRSGKRDHEIILMAKQMAIRHFFKWLQANDKKVIYRQ